MNTTKNFGFIECGAGQDRSYQLMDLKDHHLTKAVVLDHISEENIKSQYPEVEIVNDTRSIIHDNNIELVIVSAPSEIDMDMVSEVLHAGKHVRII